MHNPQLISEDVLFDVYKPVDAPAGNVLFDFEDVRHKPVCHVWTVVDGEDGGLYAQAGFHIVNRVGYLLTELPWPDEQAEALYWPADENEED